MKVSELAIKLKKQNKEVLAKAAELGIDAKGATKNLSDAEVKRIEKSYEDDIVRAKDEQKSRMMPRRVPKTAASEDNKELILEENEASKDGLEVEANLNAVIEDKPAKEDSKIEVVESEAPKQSTEVIESKEAINENDSKEEVVQKEVKQTNDTAEEKSLKEVKVEKDFKKTADHIDSKREKPVRKPEHADKEAHKNNNKGATQGEDSHHGKGRHKDKKPSDHADKSQPGKGKPITAKDRPQGDSFRPGQKKKKGKPILKKAAEDPKAIKRTPILQNAALEKKPIRSPRRPKVQPKVIDDSFNIDDLAPGTFVVNVPITVAGFAEQVEKSTSEIILTLMKMGVMANINQNLDEDTVQLLAIELDILVYIGKDEGEIVEEGLELFEDDEKDLVPRPPIITVMGHVDHGKTSLLDAIRSTSVQDKEAGGITQHIGASEVKINNEKIVFLDTPGHEAFTAMRARGAHVTDIAVLVVAADDSVKPQTIESISHAKAAGVPIIVAINKMDKPGANPDLVKKDLADHDVLVEDWGGDIICVPVSAKTGEGITNLLEMILLQAEVLELSANPKRLALGTVIEARLDKSKGPISTVLVLNGTLINNMSIVAGTTSAKIRTMTDFKGKPIRKALPATAVEITGFSEVPQAGDEFYAVKDDKIARDIAETRRIRQREEVMARSSGTSLENLFSKIKDGEIKDLNLIIKADVMGSVGAIAASLEKIDIETVRVNIIHKGVGTVTESDVMLAGTSGAIIIGFNVRPNSAVTSLAESEGVEIRTYRVIYDVIDEVESALKGMLDPEYKEVVLGKVEIRETFKVPGVGVIGGSYVTEGKILRNAEIRLVRDGIVIHEGKISSLKRFKDDVKEVSSGYECGIGIEKYNDIKEGDIIEAFVMEEIKRD